MIKHKQGFFVTRDFFFLNITVTKVTKIAAIEATSFTANCGMQTVVPVNQFGHILGRELDPCGVSPNQRSRWKHAFSPLKHV